MLFNSVEFLIFLPLVFCSYWFLFSKSLKLQNSFLLVASYFFYGWWDYRFLSLILLSTVIDYFVGILIERNTNKTICKSLLATSLITNIGILCYFKYSNFFIESLSELLISFGINSNSLTSLQVILPVGISFYTFQTLSYTIDVYRREIKPTRDFLSFAAFVSFFPQLVAGPIERASSLLPQILNARQFNFNQAIDGLRLIVWGLFKKVIIADSLAPIVNYTFENYSSLDGTSLALGAVYFAFQIYGDFSGYSDIAIGTSKLFGFELMTNFNYPYFSRNIAEFWRRWHISLSTWFRDYLYIPLGGSKGSKIKSIRNIFIIFIVSGFWHGANWTFIAWGGIHASLYLPTFILGTNRKYLSKKETEYSLYEKIKQALGIINTFIFVTLAWIFFRANNINEAYYYIIKIFTKWKWNAPASGFFECVFILMLICLELLNKGKPRKIQFSKIELINNLILLWMIFEILRFLTTEDSTFIYFAF